MNNNDLEFNPQRFEAAYKIVQECDTAIGPSPVEPSLHIFDAVISTNQTAWELVEQGAQSGTSVLALQQSAGRGQWGRQWSSPWGGLYLSVALEPDLAVENSAQLTLCTVWGIANALREIPGKLSGVDDQIPVQIKWLNDLVLDGRKLGGILTETRLRQNQITKVVVGVGINWINPVPATGINLKTFLECQENPLIESLEMLTAITLYGLMAGFNRWQNEGIQALLPSYLKLLTHRDRPIAIKGQSGTITGVTPTGDLRIRLQPDLSIGKPFQTEFHDPCSEILVKPGTISLGYNTQV